MKKRTKKRNSALECFKSISVYRLLRELSRLPPTQKIALMVNGRVYGLSPGAIRRDSNGNFITVKRKK